MLQAVPHGRDDSSHDGVGVIGQAVVNPLALLSRANEACPAQVGEMSRHLRLRQAQALVDVADAGLAGSEQRKDAQACAFAERPEDALEVGDRRR